jgi:hypothetical protein
MYRMQYGVTGYHANCHDNLLAALRELGLEPDALPTAFNFLHERRRSPRWTPTVRATPVSRRRLDAPARGDGSRDRTVGVPGVHLQRRRAAATAGV